MIYYCTSLQNTVSCAIQLASTSQFHESAKSMWITVPMSGTHQTSYLLGTRGSFSTVKGRDRARSWSTVSFKCKGSESVQLCLHGVQQDHTVSLCGNTHNIEFHTLIRCNQYSSVNDSENVSSCSFMHSFALWRLLNQCFWTFLSSCTIIMNETFKCTTIYWKHNIQFVTLLV